MKEQLDHLTDKDEMKECGTSNDSCMNSFQPHWEQKVRNVQRRFQAAKEPADSTKLLICNAPQGATLRETESSSSQHFDAFKNPLMVQGLHHVYADHKERSQYDVRKNSNKENIYNAHNREGHDENTKLKNLHKKTNSLIEQEYIDMIRNLAEENMALRESLLWNNNAKEENKKTDHNETVKIKINKLPKKDCSNALQIRNENGSETEHQNLLLLERISLLENALESMAEKHQMVSEALNESKTQTRILQEEIENLANENESYQKKIEDATTLLINFQSNSFQEISSHRVMKHVHKEGSLLNDNQMESQQDFPISQNECIRSLQDRKDFQRQCEEGEGSNQIKMKVPQDILHEDVYTENLIDARQRNSLTQEECKRIQEENIDLRKKYQEEKGARQIQTKVLQDKLMELESSNADYKERFRRLDATLSTLQATAAKRQELWREAIDDVGVDDANLCIDTFPSYIYIGNSDTVNDSSPNSSDGTIKLY